jgi:hypothetical protein
MQDAAKIKAITLDVDSPKKSLFNMEIKGYENLKNLIYHVRLSFTSGTDNIIDREMKLSFFENTEMDAFKFLNSIGTTPLMAKLNVFNKQGDLIRSMNIGFKIDFFRTDFDWNQPNDSQTWDVVCKVNSLS